MYSSLFGCWSSHMYPTVVMIYSYSSGGEDGYVRIHYFDPQYFDFELEA